MRARPGAVQSADTEGRAPACRGGCLAEGSFPTGTFLLFPRILKEEWGCSGDPKCLELWVGALAGRSKSMKGRGGGARQSNSYSRMRGERWAQNWEELENKVIK